MRTMLFIFFPLIVLVTNAQLKADGSIVYGSVVLSDTNQSNNFFESLFPQPDTLFLYTIYNNKNALQYTSARQKFISEGQVENLTQFEYIHADSGFFLKKNFLCTNLYKIKLPEINLVSTGKIKEIQGIKTFECYSVNNFNDTTIYYSTNILPKTAGIMVLKNWDMCILEIRTINEYIFPLKVLKSNATYHLDNLLSGPIMEVSNKRGIDGGLKIEEKKLFPLFISEDINGDEVANKWFANSYATIFILLDQIKHCENYDANLEGYYKDFNERNNELLSALDSLALLPNIRCFILTDEYLEEVTAYWGKKVNYKNLRVIPNSSLWKQRHGIFQSPFIIVVDKNGIVKRAISFLEIEDQSGLYQGLIKLL